MHKDFPMTPPNSRQPNKKTRIRLPFEERHEDIGQWAYRHRVGLCVTLIIYLVLTIVFMSAKIVISTQPHTQGMYIDLNELAELEAIRDKLQEEVSQKQRFDWGQVKNLVSNEDASTQEVKDDRGTNVSELNNSASEALKRMEANRQEYERGLAEAEALRSRQGSNTDGESRQDRKIEGSVTASYSLNNPLRHARNLIIPAYRCQGGGEVVVSIIVNNIGEVTSAKVLRGGDDCMRQSALNAARSSLFDTNSSAPARHQGEITYIFIPQ